VAGLGVANGGYGGHYGGYAGYGGYGLGAHALQAPIGLAGLGHQGYAVAASPLALGVQHALPYQGLALGGKIIFLYGCS